MSSTMTRPSVPGAGNGFGAPPPSGRRSTSSDTSAIVQRWMWTWITIGLLVVLVVIGFLIAITNSLASIDDNLFEADSAVTGAGGDVEPLPGQVAMVNETLAGIDTELAAVPGQADEIIAALTSVRDSLVAVDASLVDTSGTLSGTSGSLVDTDGVLARVLALAGDIEGVLESAESPDNNDGTSDIFQRVATANGVLQPAKDDTGNIIPQLESVNTHLESICNGLPTGLITGGECAQ